MSQRMIGDIAVFELWDGVGPFFERLDAAFPAASGDAWRRAAALDPSAFAADGGWLLTFRCFALRFEDGTTVLVDAGIGPAVAPAADWAPVPGRLPAALAEVGIASDDVQVVVLTHLHTDHVGWAVVDGQPFFSNARYVLQRREYEVAEASNSRLSRSMLEPLRAAGLLQLLEGHAVLAPEMTVVPTPGHTPGHQSVVIASRGAEMIVTGDVLVHAVQLADPTVAYSYEVDPDTARETRLQLLADAKARRSLLATAHLTEPFLVPV
jgi:glyoxylase-like metal-dependent hydrolase (beta-lactamase superfamily II)